MHDEGRAPWTGIGFMFVKNVMYDQMGILHVHHNSLQVVSQKEHNNTVITCAVVDGRFQAVKSNAVKIIIMGAPSSPVPIPMFNNPGVVILEWDTPFSWPEYPVQSYDIIVPNHPELTRGSINETNLQFIAGDNQHDCKLIKFRLRASSVLGDSKYGSVITGFPIETQLMDNTIDNIKITPQSNNLKPQVCVDIKLPRVCRYQSINYTITVTVLEGVRVVSLTRGPFNGTINNDIVVITEELDWGRTYQISVGFTVDVLSEALLNSYKDIYINPRITSVSSAVMVTICHQEQFIIIGCTLVGGFVMVCITLTVVTISLIVCVKLRKHHDRQGNNCHLETNITVCGDTSPQLLINTDESSKGVTQATGLIPQPLACHSIDGEADLQAHFYEESSPPYERAPSCNVAQILNEAALKGNTNEQTSTACNSQQPHRYCIGSDYQQNGKKNPVYDQVQTHARIHHCDFPLQTITTKPMVQEQVQSPNVTVMESTLQSNQGKENEIVMTSYDQSNIQFSSI